MINKDIIFITGMFRSGTTLLARILNTHPNMAVASDPLRPIFNSFCYAVSHSNYKQNHTPLDPLNDYYNAHTDLLATILKSNFHIPLAQPQEILWELIVTRAKEYSGLWAKNINYSGKFPLYSDIMSRGLNEVEHIYGQNKDINTIGFKEVWSTEMTAPLFNTFQNSKAILMVRDPRAVAASKNSRIDKYPLSFMARQWRKLTFLTLKLKQKYPERILVLKYEDLISDFEPQLNKICDFLNLPLDSNILNPTQYKDGNNRPWGQNSSYSYGGEQKIESLSINKWEKVLSPDEIKMMELCCFDGMDSMQYHRHYTSDELLNHPIENFPRLDETKMANWIKPYNFENHQQQFNQSIKNEKQRLQWLIEKKNFTKSELFDLQITK